MNVTGTHTHTHTGEGEGDRWKLELVQSILSEDRPSSSPRLQKLAKKIDRRKRRERIRARRVARQQTIVDAYNDPDLNTFVVKDRYLLHRTMDCPGIVAAETKTGRPVEVLYNHPPERGCLQPTCFPE